MEEILENLGGFIQEPLLMILLILVPLAIFFFLFRYERRRRERMRQNFVMLAQQIGCSADLPRSVWKFPSITGYYRKRLVQIWMHTTRRGRNKVTYTAIRAQCKKPPGFHMAIGREGILGKVAKAFGKQDIIIGDEEFDKMFLVRSNNESLARSVFPIGLRHKIVELGKKHSDFAFQVKDDGPYFEKAVMLVDAEKVQWFRQVLDVLCEVAERVEKSSGMDN
jgi:hypothetical protein